MTADQPLVTHADLEALAELSLTCNPMPGSAEDMLLDRLIAAAEADKPALPEGWVLLDMDNKGELVVLWHDGSGYLYNKRGSDDLWGDVKGCIGAITPLVTAASLVPEGWHVDEDGDGRPTIWDADNLVILGRVARGADPLFDVLAALVTAAQAERGESR